MACSVAVLLLIKGTGCLDGDVVFLQTLGTQASRLLEFPFYYICPSPYIAAVVAVAAVAGDVVHDDDENDD